jgi:hypothetical protein
MRYVLALFILLFALPLQAQKSYTLDEDLIYRINFGSDDDIRVLLEKGANPNAKTPEGVPAIFIAISRNDAEALLMAKSLLAKGANPNAVDNNGNYPIVMAIRNNQADTVNALMAAGANPHIKTTNGVPLLTLANETHNSKIITPIKEIFDKEEAYATSLRTPERFKEIIRLYGFHSCSYQYWNYVLSSRQAPEKSTETQAKIDTSKTTLAQLLEQIQHYYPTTKAEDLQAISNESAQTAYDQLDVMISNRNRAEHGVGKEEDVKQRCQVIADGIKVNFVPANLKE